MQVLVVTSFVMVSLAVAEPSYVITSRRVELVVVPAEVSDTRSERITVPAVGYVARPLCTGMTTLVTVSPIVRMTVRARRPLTGDGLGTLLLEHLK